MGRQITEDSLFDLAKNLLAQVVVDGRAWPCANLSLSVGGFEDGVTGNKGIGGFLVRGDEAKALAQREDSHGEERGTETPPPNKRRKVDGGIGKFFSAPPQREESALDADGDEDETDAETMEKNEEQDAAEHRRSLETDQVEPSHRDKEEDPTVSGRRLPSKTTETPRQIR